MFNTRIPLYGILIVIAIVSGLLFIYKNAKNLNLKKEEIIGLLIYIGLGTIFGAKYFTFITNFEKYDKIFDFSKIGLSSYGAVIGIIIMLYLFSIQFKKKFKDLIYIILPSIPLMYGIGKIGCFLAGCCYGIEYKGVFNVVYNYSPSAPKGVHLFPIQFLEAIIFIIIFLYSFNKVKQYKINNKIVGQIFIICGLAKFLLDYLRMSHIRKIFSINQIVSIIFIILGLFLIFVETKIRKKIHK